MGLEVPYRFETERLLWTVEDVVPAAECRRLIEIIEAADPGLATDNPLYRNQDRLIRDDPEWAGLMFERLRPHLPETMGGLRLLRLNERLRLYRYRVGQRFAPHTDHWYRPNEREITLHTVLVYLNDDFDGGQTVFIEDHEATVVPKQGSVLIFQHKLRHEGREVTRGRKYAIRTDVLYGL